MNSADTKSFMTMLEHMADDRGSTTALHVISMSAPANVYPSSPRKRKHSELSAGWEDTNLDDDHLDSMLATLISNRKTPKTYSSGQNHWKKFRKFRNKPLLLNASTPRENEQEILRFLTYFMVYAPNVNKWTTVVQYLTHVKHLHKEAMFGSTRTPFEWPSNHDISRIGILSNVLKTWYEDTEQPSGGRLPATCGILDMLYHQLDMSIKSHRNTWIILLMGRIGGIRTGEVVAYTKDPALRSERDTKKLFKRKDVLCGTNKITLNVLGKTTGKKQFVLLPHEEIDELKLKFGEYFNLTRLINEDIENRGEDDLLFQDEDGRAFTYNNFMDVLSMAVKKAGLPPGRFGGHSGRIALATILHARKHSDSYIKKRGRWISDSFLTYIRQLHMPISSTRLITFRIGDLLLDLRNQGFPDVYEFQK